LHTDEEYETYTDNFGAFIIKDLKWNHRYEVVISREGYEVKMLVVSTASDVVLREVRLRKIEK